MKTITATQASRNFAALLDEVERGQTVVITRDGRPIGRLEPELATTAQRVKAAFGASPPDPGFARHLEETQIAMRKAFTSEVSYWPDE